MFLSFLLRSAETSEDVPSPIIDNPTLKKSSEQMGSSSALKKPIKSNLNPLAPEWFPQRLNPGPPAFFPMEPNMFADGTQFYSTFYNSRTAARLYEPRLSTPLHSARNYVSPSDVIFSQSF